MKIKDKEKQNSNEIKFHHLMLKPSISDLFWHTYIFEVLVIYYDK